MFITQKVFLNPVLTSSGIIYEYDAIKEYLKNNDTCPITRIKISKDPIPCLQIKNMIHYLLKR